MLHARPRLAAGPSSVVRGATLRVGIAEDVGPPAVLVEPIMERSVPDGDAKALIETTY